MYGRGLCEAILDCLTVESLPEEVTMSLKSE